MWSYLKTYGPVINYFAKGFEQNPSVFSHEVWQGTCHEGMVPVFLSGGGKLSC